MAAPLLEYSATGAVARRNGNRDPVAVPHGCYPCRDDGWCVISCWDDEEWQRLCRAAGAALSEDARFQNAEGRRAHERELNAALASWTRARDATEVMRLLQGHGVHAAVVNTVRDLFADPQLLARAVWQEQEHPEIGRHRYRMVSYQLAETPGRVRRAAPCLGQDNDEVFSRWLGLEQPLALP
jgi:crotonobetainyl-CoA:carnitine CoA-transferase CaiB-like acyl-CoA transferase